jgi:hypothetical protein
MAAEQLVDDSLGNVLGERRTYVYVSDRGDSYNMDIDNSIAVAVDNTPSTDATLPGLRVSQKRPLRPRYILAENADGTIRKRIVIGNPANPLFTGADTSFTANGVTFEVTSAQGEKAARYKVLSNPG